MIAFQGSAAARIPARQRSRPMILPELPGLKEHFFDVDKGVSLTPDACGVAHL